MSEQRKSSIEYTKRGKRVFALAGVLLTSAATTPFIAKAFSGNEKADTKPTVTLSLNEQQDAEIARQLPKGPGPNDTEIARVPILPGEYVTDIMDRVAPASDTDSGVPTLQNKATTASSTPAEMYYGYPNDQREKQERLVVWEDGDLAQKFGEAAILAIPENQINQP